MKDKATSSSSASEELWVNVFRELSYSSHAIPPKTKYPRTKVKSKMVTHNTYIIIESFKNVFELEIHKKPKSLKEVACNRMLHHKEEPQSMASCFWRSGMPQFVGHLVAYYPDLMSVCADIFNPASCSINNSFLRIVISLEEIRAMNCCPIFEGTKVFSKKTMEEFWGS